MAVNEFQDSEQEYQTWLKDHENGYVINTLRGISITYMVLHRATCHCIRQYNKMAQKGGFTERKYIKVCAESIPELTKWIKENGKSSGKPSGICSFCDPK